MLVIRYALVVTGMILSAIGAQQVAEGIPSFYVSRGIGDLQADANEILIGIAWLIGGLASGVFALAFTPPPHRNGSATADVPPAPSPP